LGLISLGHVVFGVVLAFFVPPPAPESWGFIAASTIIHFAYYYLLHRSYTLGDLSQTYPIARGISPVLITLGALFFVGEHLSVQALAGILVVTAGIFLLSSDIWRGKIAPGLVLTALATGLSIAAYSLVDGIGARTSQATAGYIAWLFVFEIFVVLFVISRRRQQFFSISRKVIFMGVGGGVISALAYGLVIYAKTLSPLGMVSTLRETSVLFAALIGVVLLGERPWRIRLAAAFVVLSGVLLLALA
jgi:drug/metabolite transporter (DMT)-like permease